MILMVNLINEKINIIMKRVIFILVLFFFGSNIGAKEYLVQP